MPHLRDFRRSLGILRASGGWALLAALAFGLPSTLPAQQFGKDPVLDLRQALRRKDTAATRGPNLEVRANAVRSPGDLARALLLIDWQVGTTDPQISAVDTKVYASLIDRFTAAVKQVVNSKDPVRGQAMAELISEIAESSQNPGNPNPLLEEMLQGLTEPLIEMTRSRALPLQIAATRALGKTQPKLKEATAELQRLLQDPSLAIRRAAADAVNNLIQAPAKSQRSSDFFEIGDKKSVDILKFTTPRLLVLDAALAAVPLAGQALQDPDAEVRRNALLAIQGAAVALRDMVLVPPVLDYPLNLEPLPEEEKTKIYLDMQKNAPGDLANLEKYRTDVETEQTRLKPLIAALAQVGPALATEVSDDNPTLRVLAAHTIEDIAFARQRQRQQLDSLRNLPPREAVKPPDKKEEAKALDGNPVARADFAEPADAANQKKEELLQVLRQSLPGLTAAVSDRNQQARLAAIDALEMLDPASIDELSKNKETAVLIQNAVRALVKALRDPSHFVRWSAARTLGKMQQGQMAAEIVPGLIPLLEEDDLDVALAGATALDRLGPAAAPAVPALARTVGRGDEELRVAALQALLSIGRAAVTALPAVIDTLKDKDPRVRKAGATLLSKTGSLGRPAIPALRKALADPDAEVRKAASDALLVITAAPEDK
jgi:HEAT repeat protein